MNQQDLRGLLRAVRAGDAAAFEALYDMLSRPVFTIALRITGDRPAAEDITQEVFLRLWQSPPSEDVRNPRAFIFQSVHNLAVDALRRKSPEPLPEALPDPADPFAAVRRREAVSQAMQSLPPDEREIVTLHIDAELPFHEIAGLMGCSLSSVYRSWRRALKRLRAELADERD